MLIKLTPFNAISLEENFETNTDFYVIGTSPTTERKYLLSRLMQISIIAMQHLKIYYKCQEKEKQMFSTLYTVGYNLLAVGQMQKESVILKSLEVENRLTTLCFFKSI